MRLSKLLETVRSADVKAKGVDGWTQRGSDDFIKPLGVMLHHTASSPVGGNCPALNTVTHGRSDLPGPLCHILVCRTGRMFVIANGKANHAGEGSWKFRFKRLFNNGNSYFIGIEIENNGLGEGYPPDQYAAVIRVTARLLEEYQPRLYKKSPQRVVKRAIGHKEWTSRKIDPSFDMDKFRRDLLGYIRGTRE